MWSVTGLKVVESGHSIFNCESLHCLSRRDSCWQAWRRLFLGKVLSDRNPNSRVSWGASPLPTICSQPVESMKILFPGLCPLRISVSLEEASLRKQLKALLWVLQTTSTDILVRKALQTICQMPPTPLTPVFCFRWAMVLSYIKNIVQAFVLNGLNLTSSNGKP